MCSAHSIADEPAANLGIETEDRGEPPTHGAPTAPANSGHGCDRPDTSSPMMRAATVPLVIPHLANPVAANIGTPIDGILPTDGSRVAGM